MMLRRRDILSNPAAGGIVVPPQQWLWHYQHYPLVLPDNLPHPLFPSAMPVPFLYLEADLINEGPIAIGLSNVGFPLSGAGTIIDCIADLAPGDWIKWEQGDAQYTGVLVAPDGDIVEMQLGQPDDLVDAAQFYAITGYNVATLGTNGPVNNLLHITIGNRDRS